METIEQFITELKKKLSVNDHESILLLLDQYLYPGRPNYDNFILIKADYRKCNDDVIKGFVLYEQQRLAESMINGRLLRLFNSLSIEDVKHLSVLKIKEGEPQINYKLPIEEISFEEIYEEFKHTKDKFSECNELLASTVTNKNEQGIRLKNQLTAMVKKQKYDKKLAVTLAYKLLDVFRIYAKGLSDSAQKIGISSKLFYEATLLMLQKGYSIDPNRYSLEELEFVSEMYKFLQKQIIDLRSQFIDQLQKDHEATLNITYHEEYQRIGKLVVQARGELISSLTMHISNIMFFENEINQLILKIKTYKSQNNRVGV